ncbi:MAG: hypothetical protein JKY15_00630 [Deltaproteobacteria bacterium]|nr:hypothetical protein [Deltaproteobacteria bacterium]
MQLNKLFLILLLLVLGSTPQDYVKPSHERAMKLFGNEQDQKLLNDIWPIIRKKMQQAIGEPTDPKSIEELKEDVEELGEFLEKITSEPEGPRRLLEVVQDLAGKGGEDLRQILRDAAQSKDYRETLIKAMHFSECCEYWGISTDSDWVYTCVPLCWPWTGLPTGAGGESIEKFSKTRLKKNLDFLKILRARFLQEKIDTENRRPGGSQLKIKRLQDKLSASAVPKWAIGHAEECLEEAGIFVCLDDKLPELIKFSVRYTQFLTGVTNPKALDDLSVEEFREVLNRVHQFVSDPDNGLIAIFKYAQEGDS